MFVGVACFEIYLLEHPRSLKAKRAVVKGLLDKLKYKLHISAAEVDHHDLWQRAALGVACVSSDKATVQRILDKCRSILEQSGTAEVVREHIDVYSW